MKKILSFLFISLSVVVVTGGIFISQRYYSNPEQIVPLPYNFSTEAPATQLSAPILIIGDRMGSYFSKFKAELATTISVDLSAPIKIQSMARDGHGLHRTLHELKGLTGWPQILIYQGGSEEFWEQKFELSEIKKIQKNFERYGDERAETLLILYPWLSRILYEPVNRTNLPEAPKRLEEITEDNYLKRLETELLLYEQQLLQLVALSKDRNSLLILTTTPINLDSSPKKVCEFTNTIEIEKEFAELRELLKANDPKSAYARSSKLVKTITGNALLFYIHGQISRRLGYLDEAKSSLRQASAFDCEPWRSTEVFNSIIRKVSESQQVLLFDFAKMLEQDWTANPTYVDEIYPQNLYYERATQQLGLLIKDILKL